MHRRVIDYIVECVAHVATRGHCHSWKISSAGRTPRGEHAHRGRRGNAGSIRAYERCGFVISERGDFPIGNGYVMEDFIMVRQL